MKTAVHRCLICDLETFERKISDDLVSHHCYCGFIEPERRSSRPAKVAPDLPDVSATERPAFSVRSIFGVLLAIGCL